MIASTLLFAFLSSLLNKLFFNLRYGEGEECVLLPLSFGGIVVAFILLEIIFIAWQLHTTKSGTDEEKKSKRIFKIIVIACLSLILLVPVFTSNTFTRVNSEYISKNCFFEYKSYNVETDVERCTLSCTQDGNLAYVITMSDGEKIEIFGNVNSCGKEFIKKHENMYGYAANLSQKLSRRGLVTSVIGEEHIKRIYQETDSEIWKHLEKIITESE